MNFIKGSFNLFKKKTLIPFKENAFKKFIDKKEKEKKNNNGNNNKTS